MIITPETLTSCLNAIAETPPNGQYELKINKVKKTRSGKQNRSEHLYFTQMSQALNDAGFSQKMLMDKFKGNFDLPVTEIFIKDIFREAGHAMFGKKSTADLTTIETQDVYKAVDLRLAEITGVSLPFPSGEPPAYNPKVNE